MTLTEIDILTEVVSDLRKKHVKILPFEVAIVLFERGQTILAKKVLDFSEFQLREFVGK